jgi:ATP-binding cassette subfamily F protein 3
METASCAQSSGRSKRARGRCRHRSGRQGEALAHLHHRYDEVGGYSARARAATLLSGSAFPRPPRRSRSRILRRLADAAQSRAGLDVPLGPSCCSTNRPTTSTSIAVLWLEDWLTRYPARCCSSRTTAIFSTGVVDGIVHFDARKLKSYTGNYSQFERERAQQLRCSRRPTCKQQRQIAHLQAFVDRFRAKATKAKQAQSRMKALERMETDCGGARRQPVRIRVRAGDDRHAAARAARARRRWVTRARPPVLPSLDWGILTAIASGSSAPTAPASRRC